MKKSENIKKAFKRYLSNQYSLEDFKLLQSYFKNKDEGELFDLIQDELAKDYTVAEEDKVSDIIAKTDYNISKLMNHEHQKAISASKHKTNFLKVIGVTAASLICIVSISLHFLRVKGDKIITGEKVEEHIKTGNNNAILILGDGTTITLDSMDNGVVASEAGLLISKDDEGIITYRMNPSEISDNNVSINTVKTPKGGQYKIVLEDGTKVWLNSASSIQYPNRFNHDERRVELIGEAYFDVSKSKTKPFVVITNGQKVKVLGTEFNINTNDYKKVTTTTLIEGSIEVTSSYNKLLLKPSQQAVMKDEKVSLFENVNIEEVTAWKRGEFYFDGAKIDEIMNQIQSWYDIDVEFNGTIDHSFVLKIKRDVHLSEILKILEMTELVHFKLEGNKIIVTP